MDEVVTWFCPNCLFEVPGGTVRGDGNRYVELIDGRGEVRIAANDWM